MQRSRVMMTTIEEVDGMTDGTIMTSVKTSRLEVERDGDIRALDWRGLHGDVKRDRIEWANGSTWTKSPERLSRR